MLSKFLSNSKQKIKKTFYKYLDKFIAIAIVCGILFIGSHLPYINLLFNVWFIIFSLIVSGTIIFNLSLSKFFSIGIILLLFSLVFSLLNEAALAEHLGNMIYGILCIGILWKTIKWIKRK